MKLSILISRRILLLYIDYTVLSFYYRKTFTELSTWAEAFQYDYRFQCLVGATLHMLHNVPKLLCWIKVIQWTFLLSEEINNIYILKCKIKMEKLLSSPFIDWLRGENFGYYHFQNYVLLGWKWQVRRLTVLWNCDNKYI